MTMMNTDDLDSNVVGIAAFLYILADLEKTVRNVGSVEEKVIKTINNIRKNDKWNIYVDINYETLFVFLISIQLIQWGWIL